MLNDQMGGGIRRDDRDMGACSKPLDLRGYALFSRFKAGHSFRVTLEHAGGRVEQHHQIGALCGAFKLRPGKNQRDDGDGHDLTGEDHIADQLLGETMLLQVLSAELPDVGAGNTGLLVFRGQEKQDQHNGNTCKRQ